jgi:hypothetical protein
MGGEVLVGARASEVEVVHVVAPDVAPDGGHIVEVIVQVIVEVVAGIVEARTPERLTETRRTPLHATTGVMDAPDGSPAVPTGEVDDPARAPPLVSPSDWFEKISTDGNGVGQTADLLHHFPFTLWTHGHDDSSLDPATLPVEHGVWL